MANQENGIVAHDNSNGKLAQESSQDIEKKELANGASSQTTQLQETGQPSQESLHQETEPKKDVGLANGANGTRKLQETGCVVNGDLTSISSHETNSSKVSKSTQGRKPFIWCRWVAKWPKLFFALTLFGHLAFIGVTVGLYFSGYNIQAFVFKDLPLEQINDVMYRRHLAWYNRKIALRDLTSQRERHEIRKRSVTSEKNKRYGGLHQITLIYDAKGQNILTMENLKKIQDYENHLFGLSSYQRTYCQNNRRANDKCWPFKSFMSLFYNPATNKTTIRNITDILANATDKPHLREEIKWMIGKDLTINTTENVSFATKIKSEIYFGFSYDRTYNEQLEEFETWALNYFLPYLEESIETWLKPLTLYYWSDGDLYWAKISLIVFSDLYLLLGSVSFIFIFTWILTTSLWVTTWGIFSIVTSFLCANLIYNVGIGYKYFGIFNVLAIFLVLGIGVDDIYVFFNTWKMLAKEHTELDLILDLCCRRAGFSMLITSITTMAAFFVSSPSQILPVSGFGTFAGLTVLVNYISVMVFFPTVVAVYHVHFKANNCFCCSFPSCGEHSDQEVAVRYRDTSKVVTKSVKDDLGIKSTDQSTEKGCAIFHRRVSHWFGKKYSRFVGNRVFKWIIIAGFGGLVGFMGYSISNMKLDNTDIQILKHDDPFEIARTLRLSAFHPTDYEDPRIEINLVWGLKPQDMSSCKPLEFEERKPCQGRVVWDSQFDINLPESQTHLLNFCEKLYNMSGEMKTKLRLLTDVNDPGKNDLECVVMEFNDFLQSESLKACYPPNTDLTLPMTASKLQLLVNCHQDVFLNISVADIKRPFEVGLQFWLYKVEESSGTSNLKNHIGFLADNNVLLTRKEAFGIKIVEARIQFLVIPVTTSGRTYTMPDDKRNEMKNCWETFMVNELKAFPKSLQGGFQTAWGWDLLNTIQDIMYRGITGLGIGTGISFIFIFAGTRNIIVCLLTLITLVGIVVCIVGIIPLAGWKLGVLEGLNMCFVVGLAVDYTIHMAQGYIMSDYSQRRERIQDALQHVAISILSGAVTTLGASCFMFFCRVHFFLQFGVFIFVTISFSILFALLLLPALLSVLGPSGAFGSIIRPCGSHKAYKLEDKGFVNEAYTKTSDESRF